MKSNTYSLATNLDSYSSLNQSQHTHAHENTTPRSIFNERELRLVDHKKISSGTSKQYQIVGWKQLKNYEGKCRRQKKNTYRKFTQAKQDRPGTRQSRSKKTSRLNKRQVLEGLPAINSIKRNCPINDKHDTWITQIEQQRFSMHHVKARTEESALVNSNSFSLYRLKESIEQKDKQWSKLLAKISRSDPKFPSVFRRIQTYRTKVEQMQKKSILHQLPNNSSSKWSKILRSNVKLSQLSKKKQIGETFHDKGQFSLSGTSKLQTEQQWLQRKDEQGYQFKKIKPTTKTPSQSIQ